MGEEVVITDPVKVRDIMVRRARSMLHSILEEHRRTGAYELGYGDAAVACQCELNGADFDRREIAWQKEDWWEHHVADLFADWYHDSFELVG